MYPIHYGQTSQVRYWTLCSVLMVRLCLIFFFKVFSVGFNYLKPILNGITTSLCGGDKVDFNLADAKWWSLEDFGTNLFLDEEMLNIQNSKSVSTQNKRNPKKKILFFQMRTIISWSYNAENFFWMQKGILPSE